MRLDHLLSKGFRICWAANTEGGGAARAARGFLLLPAGPHPCPSPQSLLWGRGTLSGSGAVRPGFGPPILVGPVSFGFCSPGSSGGGFWGGVAWLGGFGRVGCELHSGREHQECFLLFWFAAPLGPSFVLPVRSLVGGGRGSGGVRAPRGGPAGPALVPCGRLCPT